LRVLSDLLPRVALPELVAAAVYVVNWAGLLKDGLGLLSDSAEALTGTIDKIEPAVPAQQNEAKQMVQALAGRLPLLIGDEAHGSVLRRFKNELNENSKMPAVYYPLPEAYHDDIEGLNMLRRQANLPPQPIILRTHNETVGQNRTR
jgi:hypothetical protein